MLNIPGIIVAVNRIYYIPLYVSFVSPEITNSPLTVWKNKKKQINAISCQIVPGLGYNKVSLYYLIASN